MSNMTIVDDEESGFDYNGINYDVNVDVDVNDADYDDDHGHA